MEFIHRFFRGICFIRFYSYFCNATITYKRCKSAIAIGMRENITTPVISSYIPVMYVVVANFDYVELFLFNSSNATTR
mgnify:CR=1 FL=1